MNELRHHWDMRYREGVTPWDTRITPPEVVAFWQSQRLPRHGRALDFGCATGTNVIFLVKLGLAVVGVELSAVGLNVARSRLTSDLTADLSRMNLIQGDVTTLPLRGMEADYILDIGCFHGVPAAGRDAYVHSVRENLAPGGYYHLFAFDQPTPDQEPDPARRRRGLAPHEVQDRFTPALQLIEIIEGKPDRYPCRWYLLQQPPR